jgi:hypothetical protein
MGRTRAGALVTSGGAPAPDRSAHAALGEDEWQRSYTLVDGVDPDIHELCEEYEIEPRKMYKLHHIMLSRTDSFESDILKLWDSFKNARQPNAVLSKKMHDMENRVFIGKAPKRFFGEKRLKDFFKKHDMDPLSKDSLADALYDRRLRIIRDRKLRGGSSDGDGMPESDMRDVLEKLDRDIDNSRNPSALVMRQIPGIEAGTGQWSKVGKLEEAKRGQLVSQSPEREPEEGKRPAAKAVTTPAVATHTVASIVQPNVVDPAQPLLANLQSLVMQPCLPLNLIEAPAGKSKEATKAFDSAELAKRLSKAAPVNGSKAAPVNDEAPPQEPPEPEPVVLTPSQPLEAPAPEPAKPRPILQLGLSKQSVEAIAKSNEASTSNKAGPAEEPGVDFDGMSELEIAAIATGRPLAELKKLSKDDLRALLDGSEQGSQEGSEDGSDVDEQSKEFAEMSELEIVAIATGRSVKELERLPKEELRKLVDGGCSRSPSPDKQKATASSCRASRSRSCRSSRGRGASRKSTRSKSHLRVSAASRSRSRGANAKGRQRPQSRVQRSTSRSLTTRRERSRAGRDRGQRAASMSCDRRPRKRVAR